MSSPATALCALCGLRLLVESKRTVQRVRGWERKREQGGTNAILLRQTEPEWAHLECVQLAAKGIDAGQGSLL